MRDTLNTVVGRGIVGLFGSRRPGKLAFLSLPLARKRVQAGAKLSLAECGARSTTCLDLCADWSSSPEFTIELVCSAQSVLLYGLRNLGFRHSRQIGQVNYEEMIGAGCRSCFFYRSFCNR